MTVNERHCTMGSCCPHHVMHCLLSAF
jgi:hypothetical protein